MRVGNIVSFMKRHQILIACLASLIGLILALPNHLRTQIHHEGERVSAAFDRINSDVLSAANYSVCSANPQEEMTTLDMIRKSGYPAEEHFVITEDGYILRLHRIPGANDSPVVLLQHALMESSFCWVINGKDNGLAYLLADQGYDVWMGNVRGNTYSRNHTSLLPSDPEFWNFSWHEMGVYDAPAEIEYITSVRNQSLIYIGHSMGTTLFYVMASERPEVASKVKAMFGFAPVTFTENIRGIFYPLGEILLNIQTMLPLILTHTPAGTSLKTVLHFAQGMHSKKFIQYNYGPQKNMKIYGSDNPPEYDFTKIQVPIELFWAENDFLAQRKDVMKLYRKHPRKVNFYIIDEPLFNHLDFIWSTEAKKLIYSKLLPLMEKYRN